LAELPGVVEQRIYDVADTVNPELLLADLQPSQLVVEAFLHPETSAARDDGTNALVDWLTARGVSVLGHSDQKVRFPATRGAQLLWELGAMRDVRWVDEYVRPTLANDHARRLVGVDPVEPATVPWTGAGQVVGLADSGIDEQHPDFAGRLEVLVVNPGGVGTDTVDHGTHVAGSIGGAGAEIRGMAPDCRLVVQSLLLADGTIEVPFHLDQLFDKAKLQGVHIHNNSWTILARSAYREASRELDAWAYANPDVLIVAAAGNDATAAPNPRTAPGHVDMFSTNSPGTAKNALTVGAYRTDRTIEPAWSWRDYARRVMKESSFADDPIASEFVAGDPESLAAFSGRGPCDEETRLKPDVVAPGTFIVSTRSAAAAETAFWRLHDDPRYAYLGGTSMAAPIVSGLAAVVRQYYVDQRSHTPSAALLKATLANGAHWLTGADAVADHPLAPNFHQGFGRVDLANSLPIAGLPGSPASLVFTDNWQRPDEQFTAYGQTRDYVFKFGCGPLRICLAWLDPPGRGIQYPISMLVQSGTQRWFGNQSRPNNMYKTADIQNNIQVVRLEDAASGIYEIRLTAPPDVETTPKPQSFALVVTGDVTSDLQRR
jgi:serine protease AprX